MKFLIRPFLGGLVSIKLPMFKGSSVVVQLSDLGLECCLKKSCKNWEPPVLLKSCAYIEALSLSPCLSYVTGNCSWSHTLIQTLTQLRWSWIPPITVGLSNDDQTGGWLVLVIVTEPHSDPDSLAWLFWCDLRSPCLCVHWDGYWWSVPLAGLLATTRITLLFLFGCYGTC